MEIVTNRNCLSYFIQYLDTQNALPLIKFWLDADSFKLAAATELSSAASSKSGTPLMEEKLKFRTELCEYYRDNDKIPKDQLKCTTNKPICKSISLDACHNSAVTFDDNHSIHSSIDNCSLTELSEDGDDSTDLKTTIQYTSSNSNLSTEKLAVDKHRNQTMTNNDAHDNISDMGKPLTDDEKSQLCEQNQIKQNLKLKNSDTETIEVVLSENTNANTSDDSKHPQPLPQHQSQFIKRKKCFQSSLASDAIRIFKKYLTSKSTHYIDMPATILSTISLALGAANTNEIKTEEIVNAQQQQQHPIEQIFVEAQAYVLEILEHRYLGKFIESSFYCKYCVDILTGDTLQIQDIMYCESALFYLMEFLEQENELHFLEFWVAAINFRKLLDECGSTAEAGSIDQCQSDALILYEKYFSLQATSSLQMSDRIRFGIEENICTTEKKMIQHCFDPAIRIIERYLDQKYFRQFLTSHLFYKYLSELLQKIDATIGPTTVPRGLTRTVSMGGKPTTNRHRKTFSDCTYEKAMQFRQQDQPQQQQSPACISSQNTLLAMDTTSIKQKKIKSSSSDMQIDARHLYNPDLLWCRRRPNSVDGLSFGRVDALGRYERDFDMEPVTSDEHHKSTIATKSSKIRQVVRKLVNMPEDRAQEEIAWKMAEMIVRDITNVTLNGHLGCSSSSNNVKTNKNTDGA